MKHAAFLLIAFCATLAPMNAGGVSCESSAAVRTATHTLEAQSEKATFAEALVLEQQAYLQMTQLDPLDPRPARRYLQHVHYEETEKWAALREQTLAESRAHPGDPAKLLAAVMVLEGKDTKESLRLLDQLVAKNPDYAPAYVERARIYSRMGIFIDKDKAAIDLAKYYSLCPAGRDAAAMSMFKKAATPEQKSHLAVQLRARLASEVDPALLASYADVWSFEFAVLPVAEHPKERLRVQEDLRRLQALPVPASSEWLAFLREGYKQSGAPESEGEAIEARISKEFPHSDEAFDVWYTNWKDKHPEPAGEAPAAEWQAYMRLALAHYREVAVLFPQQHGFGYFLLEYSGHLEGVSPEDIVREGEAYIKDGDIYEGPSAGNREQVANAFLDHHLQPARAFALVEEARALRNSPRDNVNSEPTDYAKPKEIQESHENRAAADAGFQLLSLRASRAAGNKASAEALKSSVEAAPPTDSKLLPVYWNSRAVLAEIEGRTTDALAFYQKALFVREPPTKQYGVLNDPLLADARRVFMASQGSESAFAIWSQPESAGKVTLADGRWEKPDKELPLFELPDMQGKTWKLASLEGKKVLINIWATWCGPCQAELPHLEKLYEQTKDRSDIVILTLNFDEDVGLVEPFVKKKGFKFPVLPAYSFLANKIDVNSIPRNWLVDGHNKWLWEQIGFNSNEPDWEKAMLSRLENTK